MATPLVIQNAGMLKLNWAGPGRNWQNVIGMAGNPTLPVFDQTLANSLFTAISGGFTSSGLGALMPTTVSLVSVAIRDIHAANLPEFVSQGTAVAGTGTGDPLPLSAAAVVTLRTSGAGKSFRGRTYFSGFTETQNDSTGRQAGAVNTDIVVFMQFIHDTLSSHSLTTAVLSRPVAAKTIPAKTIVARGGFATPTTSFVARNTKWESQRRRTGRT